MLAMAAARCGKPQLALEYLLHPSPNFQFDEHGLATGGPFPYLPSNGALLTAIAMMVEGWDGSAGKFPGFPQDGSWVINAEDLIVCLDYEIVGFMEWLCLFLRISILNIPYLY